MKEKVADFENKSLLNECHFWKLHPLHDNVCKDMKFIVKKTFKTEVGIEIWFMIFDMGGGKAGELKVN